MLARSKEMTVKLLKAGVGERPIVWVGHSMGGKFFLIFLQNLK